MFQFKYERYLILFIPWILSLLFINFPELSYLLAWLGSFFIFYLSMSGYIKPIPNDLSFAEQIMRPLFLTQFIFAGYMCITSIFYFLNTFLNFEETLSPVNIHQLELVAQCQRFYCLAHAALATGILMVMKYPIKPVYKIKYTYMPTFLINTALFLLPISFLFSIIPGLNQLYYQVTSLSFIAGTLALALALGIPTRKTGNMVLCGFLYMFNFYQALITGFKEPIIINILVLGVFLYPFYKKAILLIFVPLLILLFLYLPTYNRVFRERAWTGEESVEDATQAALIATTNDGNDGNDDDDDFEKTNWEFLTGRFSEISMFTQYVKSTPDMVDYYGLGIIKQSITLIIPRILWPEKPITEQLSMERVYNAGVIESSSNVSAKPAVIVDAYLSGGKFGIFLTFLIYGVLAQYISSKAEKLFGGYLLGTALIYSGLFQVFWRGLSFEFLINSIFWSFVTMWVIFALLRLTKILNKVA